MNELTIFKSENIGEAKTMLADKQLDCSKKFASIKAVEAVLNQKFDWEHLRYYCTAHELEMPKDLMQIMAKCARIQQRPGMQFTELIYTSYSKWL